MIYKKKPVDKAEPVLLKDPPLCVFGKPSFGSHKSGSREQMFFSQGAPASAVTRANPVVCAEVHLAARVADMGEGNQLGLQEVSEESSCRIPAWFCSFDTTDV